MGWGVLNTWGENLISYLSFMTFRWNWKKKSSLYLGECLSRINRNFRFFIKNRRGGGAWYIKETNCVYPTKELSEGSLWLESFSLTCVLLQFFIFSPGKLSHLLRLMGVEGGGWSWLKNWLLATFPIPIKLLLWRWNQRLEISTQSLNAPCQTAQ